MTFKRFAERMMREVELLKGCLEWETEGGKEIINGKIEILESFIQEIPFKILSEIHAEKQVWG